jgi:hypothetical protein
MGKKRASPMPLTAIGWSVSSRMCQSRVQNCICDPAIEMNSPAHSRVKRR